jgi:nicotinate-nucleotide adenylyltransferase
MTKLCFGGSFNPLHIGHLATARAVAEAGGFEKVVLIPSARPPHKPEAAELAEPCHRLAMCQVVSRCDSFFEVEDLELTREGPSYTIDTAQTLKQRGWREIAWLIGADMVPLLPTWYRPIELLREVKFMIAQRPGNVIDWAALPPAFRALRENVVPAPLLEISASDLRQRVREGKSIRYLVPDEVDRYICEHRLYLA